VNEKDLRELSAANFEIMKIVWEHGETTINDVLEAINSRREKKIKRASVQVQMNRLEKYGWLTHRVDGNRFYYSALQEQDDTLRHIVSDVKNRVFEGASKELVRYLFEDTKASADELERIAALLEENSGKKPV